VRKAQTLELDLPDRLPRVWVDRARIEDVVGNLLSNAVKFTPRGGHIRLALRKDGNSLAVSVSDDGPGIPPDEQARIFDKFYIGRDQRSAAGVGLGLYIARQLIELHGGRITVKSMPGQGATFTFTIPVKADEAET